MWGHQAVSFSILTLILIVLNLSILGWGQESDYQQVGLEEHNKFRAFHGSDPLTTDQKLIDVAQACANYYLGIGDIDHSCEDKYYYKDDDDFRYQYGESLSLSGFKGESEAVTDAIDRWYKENELYTDYGVDIKQPTNFDKVGHFTQLVWKGTERVGIGVVWGPTNDYGDSMYVVGIYDPPGNYDHEYINNVFPPLS